jgi:hypothetical protein
MTSSTTPKARTESTDRTPALTRPAHQPRTCATRFGNTARRLLNCLMRSLANPHV